MGQHLTGITRLQDISGIGSGGNHIKDISFDQKYSTLLGFTEAEITKYFKVYITELGNKFKFTDNEVLARLKKEYNGYKFSFEDCESVYNPFSIINCFSSKKFDNFWCNTNKATQEFEKLYENYAMSQKSEKKFIINYNEDTISHTNPDFIQLLWQYGYLTIDEEREKQIILRYSNKEVQTQIENIKIGLYRKFMPPEEQLRKEIARILLIDKGIQNFAKQLCIYYYTNPKITSKSHFEDNLSEILRETGLSFSVENQRKKGKGICDIFIENENKRELFIIELKYNRASKEGMNQITDKNYVTKHLETRDIVFSISITYDEALKTINSIEHIIYKKDDPVIEKHFKVSIMLISVCVDAEVTELQLRKGDSIINYNIKINIYLIFLFKSLSNHFSLQIFHTI